MGHLRGVSSKKTKKINNKKVAIAVPSAVPCLTSSTSAVWSTSRAVRVAAVPVVTCASVFIASVSIIVRYKYAAYCTGVHRKIPILVLLKVEVAKFRHNFFLLKIEALNGSYLTKICPFVDRVKSRNKFRVQ